MGKIRNKVRLGSAVVAGAVALGSGNTFAEDVKKDVSNVAADKGAEKVERMVVTGSNIRRTDIETASPIQIFTSQEIQSAGYTRVGDFLNNITANGQGTLSQSFPGAFAQGASGISLRGLTVGATLVLIDGHRMAPFPRFDDSQREFVDTSALPMDVVDRIEILKDGASAIYGSDAIAGVVNIILKKNLVGTRTFAEAGMPTRGGGGGTVLHGAVSHGMGDFDKDGWNAYAALEYRQQDRISIAQRRAAGGGGDWISRDWSGYGGENLTPGVISNTVPRPTTLTPYLTNPSGSFNAAGTYFYGGGCNSFADLSAGKCAYDPVNYQFQPDTRNIDAVASFSKRLGDNWKLDFKGSFIDSKSDFQTSPAAFPQSFSPLVAVQSGVTPHLVGTAISAIRVPANYTGNPFGRTANVRGLMPDQPVRGAFSQSQSYRAVLEGSGSVAEIDVDAAVGYTRVNLTRGGIGTNVPALNTALNRTSNPFSVTGGNTADDIATIFPKLTSFGKSELWFAELRGSRALFDLPGGKPLSVSVGGQFFNKEVDSPAPDLVAQGAVSGNLAFIKGSQNDIAGFAEFLAPAFDIVELGGAFRVDKYNVKNGDAFTPKLSLKVTPIKEFSLRGAAGMGFRAPNAAETGDSGTAFVVGATKDATLCPGGVPSSGSIAAGSVISACSYTPVYLQGTNPNLQPESSTSITVGAVVEPIKNWETTLDAYQIQIRNQIVTDNPSTTPVRGPAVDTLCADGKGGSYNCTPSVGPVLYFPETYTNANSTTASGWELNSRYKVNVFGFGDLTLMMNWSHLMSYQLLLNGQTYELAGTHGVYSIGGATGNPRERVQARLIWDQGPLSLSGIVNWISSIDLTDSSGGIMNCDDAGTAGGWFPSGGVPAKYCRVADFMTLDTTAKYKIMENWTAHVAVNNLLDQTPPVDLLTYGGGVIPYNPSMHFSGAIGRMVIAGMSYKF